MEPEGSLPHSQQPSTCPYPEPDQAGPCSIPLLEDHFVILCSHLRLSLPSDFFLKFPHQNLNSPLLAPGKC
jgi:hypothetical protein